MTSAAALSLALSSAAAAVSVPALAHISLDAPKGRYWQASAMETDQSKQKTSPCGSGADSRTKDAALIASYKPGQKITLKFRETVQHPGHFEVSFDNEGQDFPFPGEAPSAASGVTVLVPSIADKSTTDYSVEVTLPNVECEKCTLQLVQVMTTKSPPYAKSGDLYFQCADITLRGDGSGGASSGGASGSGGAPAAGMGGASSGNAGNSSGGMNSGGATGGNLGTTGGFGTTGGSSTAGGTSASTGGGGTGGAMSSTGGIVGSTGGIMGSTGGTPASTSTGGTTNATGGTTSNIGSGGTPSAAGGATGTSSTGGASGSGTPSELGEEPGCSLRRSHGSPRSGGVLSLFALGALFGWQRRRRAATRPRVR